MSLIPLMFDMGIGTQIVDGLRYREADRQVRDNPFPAPAFAQQMNTMKNPEFHAFGAAEIFAGLMNVPDAAFAPTLTTSAAQTNILNIGLNAAPPSMLEATRGAFRPQPGRFTTLDS